MLNTHDHIYPACDRVMVDSAETAAAWQQLKQKMINNNRWSELLYQQDRRHLNTQRGLADTRGNGVCAGLVRCNVQLTRRS